jgi:para-nitrobenzyl esterase
MKRGLTFMAACLAFQVVPTLGLAQVAAPVVSLDTGAVMGTNEGDTHSFKGIPFASPPVGTLRWRAPQPAASWSSVRSATAYGPDCLQLSPAGMVPAPSGNTAEDCLYLNVWRPAESRGGRPVLVWIYGGAFVMGGSSYPLYDGTSFARQGIVFVSFNYRLGRFGFFAHPALSAAHEGPLGNYGYQDQIAALQWVKRNIAAFGGDPNHVTVMGESAGGISVLDLLVSPFAKGLFQQAIVMSGGGRAAMSNRPLDGKTASEGTAEDVGVTFARSVDIEGTDAQALARLRALPANRLLNGLSPQNLKIDGDIKSSDPVNVGTSAGGPIIDGRIKLSVVDQAIQRRQAARIPIMIGTTSGDLGVPTGQTKDELFAQFGANAKQARQVFDLNGTRSADEVREEITRDRLLAEPARFVAQKVAKSGKPAWLYRFSYIPVSRRSEWQGVPHGADTAFFFDTVDAQFGPAVTANDEAVAAIANAYVGNFVKSGNPNGAGLPPWHEFGTAPRAHLNIAAPADTTMMKDPSAVKLDLVAASAGAALIQK